MVDHQGSAQGPIFHDELHQDKKPGIFVRDFTSPPIPPTRSPAPDKPGDNQRQMSVSPRNVRRGFSLPNAVLLGYPCRQDARQSSRVIDQQRKEGKNEKLIAINGFRS
jgi:hypothetical protein